MNPSNLRPFFWDIDFKRFVPAAFPEYTVGRVLEFGDREAVQWLRTIFSDEQIRNVLRTERRLTRKSATFWAVIFGVPKDEVAALKPIA